MCVPLTIESQIKIQKTWEAICNDLDVKEISPLLITRGVITPKERDALLKEQTRREQTEKLLSLLLTKDNQHFECFQACLQNHCPWLSDGLTGYVVTTEDRQSHIASILKDCSIPERPECFEGREEDVESINQTFFNGCRLAVIQGFGGQGKTALATVIGHEFVSRWGIHSVMADMRNVSDKEDIVKNLLCALKSRFDLIISDEIRQRHKYGHKLQSVSGVESEDTMLKELTRKAIQEISGHTKKVLVILDNCESALSEANRDYFKSLLRDIHINCRNAYVLCTSRDTLHLPDLGVEVHHIKSLTEEAALSLLHWYSTPLDRTTGIKLASKCGFMALFLRLFGFLLRQDCSAEELLHELEAEKINVFALRSEPFDPHACINLTYKRLSSIERTLFQLLSLFPSYFTIDEAFALASQELKTVTKLEHQRYIWVLCDTSLLTYDKTRKLFVMHNIIQEFAKYKTSQEDREKFIVYFMSYNEPYIRDLGKKTVRNATILFQKQRDNIVKYIDYFSALSNELKEGFCTSMLFLAIILDNICEYNHAAACLKALLDVQFGAASDAFVACVHFLKGRIHFEMDETYPAIKNFTTAIDMCDHMEEAYNYRFYHNCVQNVGCIQIVERKYESALQYMDRCLSIASANNDEILRQQDLAYIAMVRAMQGDKKLAKTIIQDVLDCDLPYDAKPADICRETLTIAAFVLNNVDESLDLLPKYIQALTKDEHQLSGPYDTADVLVCLGCCLITAGQAADAITVLQEAVAINERYRGDSNIHTAVTIHKLARALSAQGNHAEALSTYQRALNILEQVLGENCSTAITLRCMGQEMIKMDNADGAVDILRRALAMMEEILGEFHEQTAVTITNLACALSVQGKHKDALNTYERALRVIEQMLDECEHTATILFYVGVEMTHLGNVGGAVDAFRRALTICEKTLGENHEHTATTISAVASCLSAQENHAEALSAFQRALRINEQVLGESRSTSETLHHIGEEMIELGNADGAVDVLRRALVIRERMCAECHEEIAETRIYAECHKETAETIHEMARAISAQGNHAQALSTYQRALRIKEQVIGENQSTALTLRYIGVEMMNLGNADGAVDVLRRALTMSEKILGEMHVETATTLHVMACVLSKQGNHVEALSTFQRALRIKEQVLGESRSTAGTLQLIGREMIVLRNADGAVDILRRALVIRERMCAECHEETVETRIYAEYHKETAETIHEMARAISAQGNHTQALSTYQRALRIMEQVLGENKSTAATLHNMGVEMINLGNADGAVDVLRRALTMSEKILGEMHVETATTLHVMAIALSVQGNHVDALSNFQTALRIKEQELGESRGTADTLHLIGKEMLVMGNVDGALEIFKRCLAMKKKIAGGEREWILNTKTFLALALILQGKLAVAVRGMQEHVFDECPSTAPTFVDMCHEMLGVIHAMDIYTVDILRMLVSLDEEIVGQYHEFTAIAMHKLARALSVQGNHAEALSTFQRALHIKEQVLGESRITAETLHCIGQELSMLDNKDEAMTAFIKALVMGMKTIGIIPQPGSSH